MIKSYKDRLFQHKVSKKIYRCDYNDDILYGIDKHGNIKSTHSLYSYKTASEVFEKKYTETYIEIFDNCNELVFDRLRGKI